MPVQTIGYYRTRKERLLKDLERTSTLMRTSLIERYGEDFTVTLQREVRLEFEKLIPEIPRIRGPRARMLNRFLLISAQELATYRAMMRHGKLPGEAWELCHEALRMGLAGIPQWKRSLLGRFLFSRFVRKIVERRERGGERAHFGDFEIEYLTGDGDGFDFGINYCQCAILNFVRDHGGEEFAPYVCMSDIPLSDAMGWGLRRTQTLADDCAYCDFRFKEDAATRITSKTPEVQERIEEIQAREAAQHQRVTAAN